MIGEARHLAQHLCSLASRFERLANKITILGYDVDHTLLMAWDEVKCLAQELELYADCMEADVANTKPKNKVEVT